MTPFGPAESLRGRSRSRARSAWGCSSTTRPTGSSASTSRSGRSARTRRTSSSCGSTTCSRRRKSPTRSPSGWGPSYMAQDWADLNGALFSALWLEKMAISITIGLIVMVAAMNIIASLVLLVMEKSRDIAILKTMGSSGVSIRRIFMLQGLVIGLVGTVAGAVAGCALIYIFDRYKLIHVPIDVYQISYVPFTLELRDFAIVVISAIVICFLATIYPSRQASRLDPAQGVEVSMTKIANCQLPVQLQPARIVRRTTSATGELADWQAGQLGKLTESQLRNWHLMSIHRSLRRHQELSGRGNPADGAQGRRHGARARRDGGDCRRLRRGEEHAAARDGRARRGRRRARSGLATPT